MKTKLLETLKIRRVRVRRAYAVASLKHGGLCAPYITGGVRSPGNVLAVFRTKRDALDWCGRGEHASKNYRIARVSIEEL